MIKTIKDKIAQLRNQPEQVRLRMAIYTTAAAGISATLVWLVLVLPFELYLHRSESPESLPEQSALNQIRNIEVPQVELPIEANTFLAAPSSVPVASPSGLPFQALPSSEATVQPLTTLQPSPTAQPSPEASSEGIIASPSPSVTP